MKVKCNSNENEMMQAMEQRFKRNIIDTIKGIGLDLLDVLIILMIIVTLIFQIGIEHQAERTKAALDACLSNDSSKVKDINSIVGESLIADYE